VTLLLDAANSKVLVVQLDADAQQPALKPSKPVLVRCNLDGTGCAQADISAGHTYSAPTYYNYVRPFATMNVQGGGLLVTGPYADKPGLVRCTLAGSGCTFTDISSGNTEDSPLPAVAQSGTSTVLWAVGHDFGGLALHRCNVDGTACTFKQVGAGIFGNAAPIVDPVGAKLLVTATTLADEKLVMYSFPL
jgi:hypothetical protein